MTCNSRGTDYRQLKLLIKAVILDLLNDGVG